MQRPRDEDGAADPNHESQLTLQFVTQRWESLLPYVTMLQRPRDEDGAADPNHESQATLQFGEGDVLKARDLVPEEAKPNVPNGVS